MKVIVDPLVVCALGLTAPYFDQKLSFLTIFWSKNPKILQANLKLKEKSDHLKF